MATYKTTGLVIRRINLGEADRLLTVLTPDAKIKAVARGVRKIKSKLAGHLELFSLSELMLAEGRSLDVIAGARLERYFENIATDYDRVAFGYMMAEMLDKLLAEDAPYPAALPLTLEALEVLDERGANKYLELHFKLRLLDLLGYKPSLEVCSICHRAIAAPTLFSFEAGGAVHASCGQGWEPAMSVAALALFRSALTKSLVAEPEKVADADLQDSLAICDRFYAYLFNLQFNARTILDVK